MVQFRQNTNAVKEIGHPLRVSFEIFPPKTEAAEAALWAAILELAPLEPHFVSVTYGAGGATRGRTHATVARLLAETHLTPAAHLTCVGASRDEIDAVVRAYAAEGVRHVVALRGDPPAGAGTAYAPHPQGYVSTAELVAGIRRAGDIEVSVAAYPEKHPESANFANDIDILKRKIDAGASRAITQFFFDNDLYESFVERVRAAGVRIPIVPGIAPIHNFGQIAHFAERAGASVPRWLSARFAGLDEKPDTRQLVAATTVAEQVSDLISRGVREFHFYTMNRADLVFAICHLIGIRPRLTEAAA